MAVDIVVILAIIAAAVFGYYQIDRFGRFMDDNYKGFCDSEQTDRRESGKITEQRNTSRK